jgi:phospholipase D1/2
VHKAERSGFGMAVRTTTRIGTVALALVLLALVWGFTPISRLANPEAVAAAMAVISASPWRFAIVLGCFLGAGLVVFPMLLLIIACAAVFGPGFGFVYSSTGMLASAALNYAIGTWLGRELLPNVLGDRRFDSMRSALMRRGLLTTAVVRAIPGSPFALVSVVAGASAIRFLDYLIGTAIGIMVPVVLLTVATEQTSRLLTEPSAIQFALLVGVIALWIAVAFGAQTVLERIAKGQGRDAR